MQENTNDFDMLDFSSGYCGASLMPHDYVTLQGLFVASYYSEYGLMLEICQQLQYHVKFCQNLYNLILGSLCVTV